MRRAYASAGLLGLWPALVLAEPRLLTVEEATAEALAQSARSAAARARADAAQDAARSLRGRMLPGLRLSDEQDRYHQPWIVAFDVGIKPVPQLKARELDTNTFSAEVEQPLLGLARLSQDQASLASVADAAQQDARGVEQDLREEVVTGILRLFEARALAGTAAASRQQLAQELEVMQARLRTGVATTADVLRVEVALAGAHQQEIQAQAQERSTRALLLAVLGRPQDDPGIDFAPPPLDEVPAEQAPEPRAALDLALARRPELASARFSAASARQRARARAFSLLPELDLEASYVHISGQSLAPVDSAYVGLKASWNAFQWGADYFDQRAAQERATAADAEQEATRRRIEAEVSVRLSQLEAAASAVAVARTTIASAEEAYRVTQALVQAGSATTTDLLDAQSALTQARLDLVRARYELAISKAQLERAEGG